MASQKEVQDLTKKLMKIYNKPVPNSMKTVLDAVEMEKFYEPQHDRIVFSNINTPFWIRLLFLITGKHLFVITNASILKHKVK